MTATISHAPRLPIVLALPLQLMPERLASTAAAQVLNHLFARERKEGELDFLDNHSVRFELADAACAVAIRLRQGQMEAAPAELKPDLTVNGTLYDYLLLVTGREDPDTLFFQRRLRMQGDTGLGVYLKNFLASVDPKTLPLGSVIHPALLRGLSLYEKLA